jgi:spore maturation protein CgeB
VDLQQKRYSTLYESHYVYPYMTNTKPNVTLITHAYFWRQGAGLWARTRETVKFLAEHTHLRIIFLGVVSEQDIAPIRSFEHSFNLIFVGNAKTDQQAFLKKSFVESTKNKPISDFYIIDKTENSFMLEVIPKTAKIILDTHDIVSERTSKALENGIIDSFALTAEEEITLFKQYDAVICIQQNELQLVSQWVGVDKAMYMPMPQAANAITIRNTVKNIGMIASGWHANVNGLDNFLKDVWPKLDSHLHLNVYGAVGNHFSQMTFNNVTFHGFQQDLESCYKDLDLVINPVNYGAGLKIKSIEALAHGLPLVATPEGASGLEALNGSGLLIAKDPADFAKKITQLIYDHPARVRLAINGLNHIKTHFNKAVCFHDLSTYLGIK